MSLQKTIERIFLLAAVAIAAGICAGCAHHEDDDPNRWHHSDYGPKKWYQSDMDSGDRSFYLGTFMDNDRGH